MENFKPAVGETFNPLDGRGPDFWTARGDATRDKAHATGSTERPYLAEDKPARSGTLGEIAIMPSEPEMY
jgi:hypothetical protein